MRLVPLLLPIMASAAAAAPIQEVAYFVSQLAAAAHATRALGTACDKFREDASQVTYPRRANASDAFDLGLQYHLSTRGKAAEAQVDQAASTYRLTPLLPWTDTVSGHFRVYSTGTRTFLTSIQEHGGPDSALCIVTTHPH